MPTFNAGDYQYPELPEDTPLLCTITDIEAEPNRFKKTDTDPETQLKIKLEIVEGEFKGEWIQTWINPTFGKKSNLMKLACAAFGVEELDSLNTDDLMGKRLYVIGDYGEDGKAQYLKPRKYKPASGASNGATRRGRKSAETKPEPEAKSEAPKAEERESEPVGAAAGGGETKSADDLDF